MKKFIYLFLVTVFAITTFTSCSKDDDDKKSFSLNNTTWKSTDTIYGELDDGSILREDWTLKFTAASKISITVSIQGYSESITYSGEYALEYPEIKIILQHPTSDEIAIIDGTFTDNKTLLIESTDGNYYFTKK